MIQYVENKLVTYRNENSEIYKLLDRPTQATLRKETAAPFKYYTVLAGIKTGKIKKLTIALTIVYFILTIVIGILYNI